MPIVSLFRVLVMPLMPLVPVLIVLARQERGRKRPRTQAWRAQPTETEDGGRTSKERRGVHPYPPTPTPAAGLGPGLTLEFDSALRFRVVPLRRLSVGVEIWLGRDKAALRVLRSVSRHNQGWALPTKKVGPRLASSAFGAPNPKTRVTACVLCRSLCSCLTESVLGCGEGFGRGVGIGFGKNEAGGQSFAGCLAPKSSFCARNPKFSGAWFRSTDPWVMSPTR